MPEKLTEQLAFMQANNAAVSYHAYRRMNLQGKEGRLLRGPARVTFDTLLRNTCVGTLTAMVDRQLTGDVQFDTGLRRREDLAFWLGLTKAGHDILFLDADLARYRITPGSKSKALFKSAIGTWRVYRQAAGLTIRQTFMAMSSYAFFAALKRIG